MIDPSNKEAVKVEKSSFDKTFINYSKCCQDFKDNLCSEEEIKHRQVAQEYNNVNKMKEELDKRIVRWISSAKT